MRVLRWLQGWRGRLSELCAQIAEVVVQRVDLVLEARHLPHHVLVLGRISEAIAAVRRIDALQGQVATSLTRRLTVALDLPPLALVAGDGDVAVALGALLRWSSVFGLALCTARAIVEIVVEFRLQRDLRVGQRCQCLVVVR